MRRTVRAAFAGQDRTFRLRLGEIAELERCAGTGIGEIMMRLASHRFKQADIRDTVRLGLEGGGLPEPEATVLVMRYVDEEPLGEHLQLAADILSAAVSGVPETPGKAEEARTSDPATSPPSTVPAPPSGYGPETSTA